MAQCAVRHLSVLNYAQGFTSWHYHARRAGLSLEQVLKPSFFHPVADMIAGGDTIMVSASDGGALIYVHASSEQAGVLVEPMVQATGAQAR